jgi:1,2-diacylglycerol 3-alpha-glucosyltransferase
MVAAQLGALTGKHAGVVDVVIIHNHPIHYKELLFSSLAERHLSFHVLFTAARSRDRHDLSQCLRNYDCSFGSNGNYEDANPLRTAWFVWASLTRRNPKVVIISGYYDVAAWVAWCWAVLHGRTKVLWAESNQFDHPRTFLRELPKKLFVQFCQLAHVYGTTNREYLIALGMNPKRIYIKRAVLDVEQFEPPSNSRRPITKTLLYVGRFEDMKNLPALLRAFSAVPQDLDRPRLKLALVGYGSLERELQELADTLPSRSLIEFRGARNNRDTVAEYHAADIFILPSTREAWGLVALEAMCCGLPVIISNRCGCARDLVTSDTGWSFDPLNEAELADLLNRVSWCSPEELERMGQRGRKLGVSYSPANCAEVVLSTVIANEGIAQ